MYQPQPPVPELWTCSSYLVCIQRQESASSKTRTFALTSRTTSVPVRKRTRSGKPSVKRIVRFLESGRDGPPSGSGSIARCFPFAFSLSMSEQGMSVAVQIQHL